jgi:4-alpha-glucanotransferase
MTDDILRVLATRAGISLDWSDQTGAERSVSPETLRAILMALGLPADNDAALRNSLSIMESDVSPAMTSRFTTARVGQPVTLPTPFGEQRSIEVKLEGGGCRTLSAHEGINGTLTLPPFLDPGYHTVLAADGPFMVATAPAGCITVGDLRSGIGVWGLTAQIYSLRTAGDGGIGNFAGVAKLGAAAGAAGADALAISPVHALFSSDAGHFSPYAPSSRLFYNPLHAEPDMTLPEDFVRQAIQEAGVGDDMARLESNDLVDWSASGPVRLKLLRQLHRRTHEIAEANPPWRVDFKNYVGTESPHLRAHATFEALHGYHLRDDRQSWNWRTWPSDLRDPTSSAVNAFAQEHADQIDFHMFLQWLTARSYAGAQRVCRDAGMAIGLIADLAIGIEGGGSQAWSRQQEILHGLRIGAPPDYYSASGQNWGLTTFSPLGLSSSAFSPFIDTLRACLRYVGGVRIDHVMGMSRLWLIPQGASALDGAYVSFPSETMFRLIALESWRHGAIVIGEDLGTLPDGFRSYLREQGIAGLRVLRFERSNDSYIPPERWDQDAAALTTTHDLASTAGWWSGADFVGVGVGDERERTRARERGILWSSFERAGVASGERPEPSDTAPVVDAAVRYIAKAPSRIKLLSIEDALGVELQPNVPGTTLERPNWRHRLSGDAGDLLNDEPVRRRLNSLGPPRPPTS